MELPPRVPGHQRFSLFHRSAEEEPDRRAWHQAYADLFCECRSVLDVGCGTGVFLEMLRERGVARVVGIDRDPEMVADAAARGFDVRETDARTDLGVGDERFDGVHASFVIETMDGDEGIAFLRRCVQALRPGGLLVVRTLNPRNAAVRDGALWMEPWTKRPWPAETLRIVLSDLGLRVVGAGHEPEGWQHTYLVARSPEPPAAHTRVPVAYQGEFFAYNSMAHVNRELARALSAYGDLAPVVVADEPREEPSVAADPRFAALRERAQRGVPACDVLIRQSNGMSDFTRPAGVGRMIQILPWEYGALPAGWTAALADGRTDEVWVPSRYCRELFVGAGVAPERVAVVPNGIDPDHFSPQRAVEPYPLATRKTFRFLYLGGVLPRKGVDVLLAAYRRAFRRDEDVALVLKIFGTRTFYPLPDGGASLRAFVEDPSAPELVVDDDDVTDEEIVRIYRSCDALVMPYRGEGFGLPMLEALACGVPVIATQGGAADEFLADDAYYVRAERRALSGSFRGMPLAAEGWWLEPDVDDLAAVMRRVFENRTGARALARRGSERVRRDWTWGRAAEIASGRLRALR